MRFPVFSDLLQRLEKVREGWRRLEKVGGQTKPKAKNGQKPKTAKKKEKRRWPFDHGPFPLVDHWRSHRNVDCLSEIVMPPDSRL